MYGAVVEWHTQLTYK